MRLHKIHESVAIDSGIGNNIYTNNDDGGGDDDEFSYTMLSQHKPQIVKWLNTSKYSRPIINKIIEYITSGIAVVNDEYVDTEHIATDYIANENALERIIECQLKLSWINDIDPAYEIVMNGLLHSDFYRALNKEPQDAWRIANHDTVQHYFIYVSSAHAGASEICQNPKLIKFAAYNWAIKNDVNAMCRDQAYFDIQDQLAHAGIRNVEISLTDPNMRFEYARWQMYGPDKLLASCAMFGNMKCIL